MQSSSGVQGSIGVQDSSDAHGRSAAMGPSARSSRLTLTLGGAGLVLAGVMPLRSRLVLIVPPSDASWLSHTWPTAPVIAVSAAVLVIAFVVLALGFGKEPGIAGDSALGKASLIVSAACVFALSLFAFVPLPTLTVSDYAGQTTPRSDGLSLAGTLQWSVLVIGLVALVVASVAVVRASVTHGVARWGLVILASLAAVVLVLQRAPILFPVLIASAPIASVLIEIDRWCLIAVPVFQLVLGVLYIIQGQATALQHRRGLVTS